MVVADVIPTQKYPSQILLFRCRHDPVSVDRRTEARAERARRRRDRRAAAIYVANMQGAGQAVRAADAVADARADAVTHADADSDGHAEPRRSPSPTPSPTPTPINILPRIAITAQEHVVTPTSVALDTATATSTSPTRDARRRLQLVARPGDSRVPAV